MFFIVNINIDTQGCEGIILTTNFVTDYKYQIYQLIYQILNGFGKIFDGNQNSQQESLPPLELIKGQLKL